MSPYTVYILECADGTYYTGITTDITRRIKEHNHSPKGAKYTQARRPVILRYHEEHPDKSLALKREIEIKRMKRSAKINLMEKHKTS